jgi:hypothetical protein
MIRPEWRCGLPGRVTAVVFIVVGLLLATSLSACRGRNRGESLAATVRSDADLAAVVSKAETVVHSSLDAGDNYHEVWIRDLNTFLQFDLETGGSAASIRAALLRFIWFQGGDGGVPDNYGLLTASKNTTASDQESSLVQAVAQYVTTTGDASILTTKVHGQSAIDHLALALDYVWTNKMASAYGLVWSGVTVDWGDVQAYSTNPIELKPGSRAIGIYANAMFSLAIRSFLELPDVSKATTAMWTARRAVLDANIQRLLWEPAAQKYRAHIYLGPSPFPTSFDENEVFYEGGTAVAAQAGLLSPTPIAVSLAHMYANMKAAHADSIGITTYPPYPASAFPCCLSGASAMTPYSYQNGGDWDWFGARMVQVLIDNGMYGQAYQAIQPMLVRVVKAGNFYEWWTPAGQPEGSASFRGAAGQLGLAALQLSKWAKSH